MTKCLYYIKFNDMKGSSQTQKPTEFEKQQIESRLDQNPSFFVRIIAPVKKSTLAQLNPDNPQDRAISLVLKMVKQRQLRQQKQKLLLQELRRKHLIHEQSQIGQISRIIDKQNFISKHHYLRESHYQQKKNRTRQSQQRLTKIIAPVEDRKVSLKRQMEVLRKSKVLNLKQQRNKIVNQILEEVIYKTVELYEKKMRFYFGVPPRRLSSMFVPPKQKNKSLNNKRKQLNLSRAYDISIGNEKTEESREEDISDECSQKNIVDPSQEEQQLNSQQEDSDSSSQSIESQNSKQNSKQQRELQNDNIQSRDLSNDES